MGPRKLLLASLFCASVAFARHAAPQVSASATDVLLTRTALVVIKVHSEGDVSALRVVAKAGNLSAAERLSAHDARMIWTPPSTRFPQIEQILVWDPDSSDAPEVAVLRLRLLGRTDLEVNTEPGAQVEVDVAGKGFGPRRADAKGHVTVPIDVPPGVHGARVLGQARGKSSVLEVPIDVPETNPLAGLMGPELLRPGHKAWLWIFHETRLQPGTLELSIQGGAWAQVRSEVDRALFQITLSPDVSQLEVQTHLRGFDAAKLSLSTPVVPEPPKPQIPPPVIAHSAGITPGIQLGGFYAGGANLGPSVAVVLGRRLPVLQDRVEGELELGFREASLSTQIPALGQLESRVYVVPVDLAARGRLLDWGSWSLDARAGGGLLLFDHQTLSAFQSAYGETGVGGELFAALQATYRLPTLELFFEIRGAFSPVRTPRLDAQLGGVGLAIGGRVSR